MTWLLKKIALKLYGSILPSDSIFSLQIQESLILRNSEFFMCHKKAATTAARCMTQTWEHCQHRVIYLSTVLACYGKAEIVSGLSFKEKVTFCSCDLHLYSLYSWHNLYETDLISLFVLFKNLLSFYFFICSCLKGPCKEKKNPSTISACQILTLGPFAYMTVGR